MTKGKKTYLNFIPIARNFSELEEENRKRSKDGKRVKFDIVDDTRKELGEEIDFEILICQMLYNLKNQEKLVFMFLLLRNDGYNIDHKSAAKTLKISFSKYNYILRNVKSKITKIIKKKQEYIKKKVK